MTAKWNQMLVDGRMEWGVIVRTKRPVAAGMTVTAKRRDGQTQDVVIARVLGAAGAGEVRCTVRPPQTQTVERDQMLAMRNAAGRRWNRQHPNGGSDDMSWANQFE